MENGDGGAGNTEKSGILADANERAAEMFESLMAQMVRMNGIRSRAEEIVMEKVINNL